MKFNQSILRDEVKNFGGNEQQVAQGDAVQIRKVAPTSN